MNLHLSDESVEAIKIEAIKQSKGLSVDELLHLIINLTIEQINSNSELKLLVKSLFDDYLDVVEVSDLGNEFHPIHISCARVMKLEPLGKLLNRMKVISHES